MKANVFSLPFVTMVFSASVACAQHSAQVTNPQPTLKWKNEIISPACLDAANPLEQPAHLIQKVNLSKCQTSEVKMSSDGWISLDYKEGGYTSYKVSGELGNKQLVETLVNGGGSGRFSNVLLVSVDNDSLTIDKRYGGGDRCNGGVESSYVENGKVIINYHVTPYDMLSFAKGDYKPLAPYKDLENSAGSCFAIARYQDDKILQSVILSAKPQLDSSWTARYRYQACFNDVYVKQQQMSSTLSPKELEDFAGVFYRTCVK